MGTFAEYVVAAQALPAVKVSESSIAEYDLKWGEITIQVKCSTQRQVCAKETDRPSAEVWRVAPHYAWNFEKEDWYPGDKRRWADIYVLARHEGFDHLTGWHFYVVPCWWLDQREAVTVRGAELRAAGWGPVNAEELHGLVSARG